MKNRKGIKPPPPKKKMVILLGYILNFPRIQKIWMHFNKRQFKPPTQRRPDPWKLPAYNQLFGTTNFQALGVVGKEGKRKRFQRLWLLRPLECSFHASKNKIQIYTTLFAQMENQQELELPQKVMEVVDGSDDFFPDFKVFR